MLRGTEDERRDIRDLPSAPVAHVRAYRELLDFRYVYNRRYLLAAVRRLEGAKEIALDIETAANRGFGVTNGAVRLIQVGIDDPELGREQFVVDCFRVDPSPLVALLARDDITKLIHYSRFERSWFLYHYGVELRNVYDTCQVWRNINKAVADRDARPPNVKLGTIVEHTLGTPLDKTEQSSYWGRTDLSDDQLEYAALDVAILPPLVARTRDMARDAGVDDAVLRKACANIMYRVKSEIKGKLRTADDETHRVAGMLDRARSINEIDTIWATSRQVTLAHARREALLARYEARRSELLTERTAAREARAAIAQS